MKWLLTLLLCLGAVGAATAQEETKPFVRGSYERIVASRTGKPFVVSFWSLSCTNCRDDLAMFGKLAKKYRNFDLVLVATDSTEQNLEISQTLQRYRLERAESWVFADSHVERLRFEVDKEWYGELPRTYFFDARGRAAAISGALDHSSTERWIRESGKSS